MTRRAQEQLLPLVEASTASPEKRRVDEEEERKLAEFCATGCGCRLVNGTACSHQFSQEHYATTRGHAAELSWNELNMTVMGQVMAHTYCDLQTLNSSRHRHAPKEREKSRTAFFHHGHKVCKRPSSFCMASRILGSGLLRPAT